MTLEELIQEHVARQQEREKRSLEIALLAIALMDESEAQLRIILERYIALLRPPDVILQSASVQAQLAAMRQEILFLRTGQMDRVRTLVDDELYDDTDSEWEWLIALYTAFGLTLAKPPVAAIAEVASAQFLGRNLETWLTDLAISDANRIADVVTVGLIRDESRRTILTSVLGDQGLDGKNGATQTTRSQVTSILDSATFATAAMAQQLLVTMEENALLLPEERYVAVIDSKTTVICRSLDGKVFAVGKGPIPPLHHHCRSKRVPLPRILIEN